MLLDNTSAKVVSEMLGHADVAFTLRVYSHVLPGMRKSAADGLNEMLF
jgi:integrase